jgi:hypothetical protein
MKTLFVKKFYKKKQSKSKMKDACVYVCIREKREIKSSFIKTKAARNSCHNPISISFWSLLGFYLKKLENKLKRMKIRSKENGQSTPRSENVRVCLRPHPYVLKVWVKYMQTDRTIT